MNRITLLIVLSVFLMGSLGCGALMNISSSSFLSKFSLEELVKKNRSPSGMICAKGAMGGMGGGSGWVSSEQYSSNKMHSFSCQISADSFDEADFVATLKADVEQEINLSGATIVNQGSSDPVGFYFEYSEGNILGRVNIEGKKSGGNYYSLHAKLNEKSAAKSE
jgi:hypothetical protein